MLLQPAGELIELKESVLESLADTSNEEAYIIACETVGPNSLEFDGILEEQSDRLFEVYCKELIEALQGTISAGNTRVPDEAS